MRHALARLANIRTNDWINANLPRLLCVGAMLVAWVEEYTFAIVLLATVVLTLLSDWEKKQP
jgi:hypothetical protein